MEECTESVYVAVGKSVDKAVHLLRWTFSRFSNSQICILHVHQLSSMIPTLFGKLPATQANPEVVSAFRREEREQTTRLLEKDLSICRAAKGITCNQIQSGFKKLLFSDVAESGLEGTNLIPRKSTKCMPNHARNAVL